MLLDDCWADTSRDENDELQPSPHLFPSGGYIHYILFYEYIIYYTYITHNILYIRNGCISRLSSSKKNVSWALHLHWHQDMQEKSSRLFYKFNFAHDNIFTTILELFLRFISFTYIIYINLLIVIFKNETSSRILWAFRYGCKNLCKMGSWYGEGNCFLIHGICHMINILSV